MKSSSHTAGRSLALLFLLVFASGCAVNAAAAPAPTLAAVTPSPTATITIPTQTPQPSPTPSGCRDPKGRIEQREVPSDRLPHPLQARVYLPPCYTSNPLKPYPVLILLHGQGFNDDQWEHLGLISTADRLVSVGEFTPFLIVLPYEEQSLADPYQSGYDSVLVEDLLPWLAQAYPVCQQRACRAIGGLSRGAAWAMKIGLSHPDLFGAIGAHSLPPFLGDYTRLPYLARAIPAGQKPAIWIDAGKRDTYLAQARHYHELLDQYKLPNEFHLFEGEHNETYWSQHVEDYLRWYGKYLAAAGPLPGKN